MSLKIENSRRVAKSRPVCMGLERCLSRRASPYAIVLETYTTYA
jgi:hypothetical protein